MLNIASILVDNALYDKKQKVAVRLGEKTFTYQELDILSNKIANFLNSKGISHGDKVALSCPNLPYFPIVYYGILKAGAVVVPMNVLLKRDEIAYLLEDSQSKAYFVFQGTPELPMAQEGFAGFEKVTTCENFIVMTADPAASSLIEGQMTLGQVLATADAEYDFYPTSPQDTAVILYTSGTTGKPKGAELTHLNIYVNTLTSADIISAGQDDPKTFLVVLPLFHSFGQVVAMNGTLYSGNEIVLLPRFEPAQAIQAFLQYKITSFAGVPTMYWAILNEAKNLSSEQIAEMRQNLTMCASGGAALPVELMNNFEKTFGIGILEGYGLSETSPLATFHYRGRPRKPGSIGQPIWGVQVKVFDENDDELPVGEVGEIVIRGHNIMKGYYNRPEATAEAMRNGWFHTGDMGKKDEDGYFYIVDRLKDMILRGGFNVYPREIEEVLMEHSDISLAAVIGIPHDEYGEEVKAYVVLNEGSSATSQDLVAWSKNKMAAYKYPRLIEICDALPMGPTGKVLKRELRNMHS